MMCIVCVVLKRFLPLSVSREVEEEKRERSLWVVVILVMITPMDKTKNLFCAQSPKNRKLKILSGGMATKREEAKKKKFFREKEK